MLLYFALLFSICGVQTAPNRETLHDAMTEEELAYYFQTVDASFVPDYEIVDLPMVVPTNEIFDDAFDEIQYTFSAFKRPIELKLRKNQAIISPYFKTYIHDNESNIKVLDKTSNDCHYLHNDDSLIASISFCSPKNIQGVIFLGNSTVEVHPLTDRLYALLQSEFTSYNYSVPHIVKRTNMEKFPISENIWDQNEPSHYPNIIWDFRTSNSVGNFKSLTLEVAVFFDEAAYGIFAPHLNKDDGKLRDMLLAYMNGVQALYHHPSLGVSLELVIVRLDILKRQPYDLPHYNGERGQLLDSFCDYQDKLNPEGDSDPEHWDMGLYISGLDFFAYENNRKSGVTMGLATVGGVCLDKYACVIAEFGTTNVFGKPYPSAGFTSVYILAHEIGHNLGMHHDSIGNSCPKDGYIMSPSRGTNGETQWSKCSAEVMTKLGWAKCLQDTATPSKHRDHTKFLDAPGQIYTAKKQCELLLRDKDAVVLPHQELSTICYNLQCKTPHRSGYYFAGPALDGTQCGNGKYCYGGSCVKKSPPKPVKIVPGGWSDWKEGQCSSGCTEKSMGHQTRRRFCNNPTPVNTDQGCVGTSVEFMLCDDKKICKTKKESIFDYASKKCGEFSKLLPELDRQGSGLQAPHEEARVWMGCAIFCRRADSGTFYTPRIELNDLGVSPYFPDGTWCHRENNINYYCIQHHCLPETFKFSKSSDSIDDLTFLQNARPSDVLPKQIRDYLSLKPNGKPLKTTLNEEEIQPKDEEWEIRDYVEIGELDDRRGLNSDDEGFNFV